MKNSAIELLIGGILLIVGFVISCPPPTLPTGGRWIANENCTLGPNFESLSSPKERCHCWGRCGYVCQPSSGGGGSGGSGGGGGTTTATTTKPSPCPNGGVWFNPQGQRCKCQSFNQQAYYVCETPATTASPGSNSSSTSTTSSSVSDTTTAASSDSTTTVSSADSTTTVASSDTTTTAASSDTTTAASSDSTTTAAATTTAAPALI